MAGYVEAKKLMYFTRDLDSEGTFSILIVSTSQSYLDILANGIYATKEVQKDKRNYNLKIHTCKSILDVLELMPQTFYVDYIIFVLGTRIGSCLVEVEKNLNWLDSSFSREKICLVNLDFSYLKTMIPPTEIWKFAKHYQFNLVNGSTKDQKSMFALTKRILNLAEACCGILSGIPMVNVV